MTKAWLSGFWQLGIVTLVTGSAITSLSFANASSNNSVLAQIQPDSTLGSESFVVNSVDENIDLIRGGTIRGTNLLHSFQEFNIGEGKAVDFANPQGIENIFSRVTGNNASQILGKLGVLGDANLFLLNPNGIIFGKNASLDVNGSFTITGAGNLPNCPGDAAVSPYSTGDVRGVESHRTSNNSTHRSWKIGDRIVEPQGVYRLANGQIVLSRECEQ